MSGYEGTIDYATGEIIDETDIPFEGPNESATPGTALAPIDAPISLFGMVDANDALTHVEAYANVLKDFVKAHDLTLEMEDGTDYLTLPAWEALGQMIGVFAEVEWTEQIQGGWKARAVAHTRSGERLTAREGICMKSEMGRNYKPEFDLHGMAQTRACRNALKAALSIVVNAAGYDTTDPAEKPMSPKQRAMLFKTFERLEKHKPRGKNGWKEWTTAATLKKYGKRISGLNRAEASEVIDGMVKLLDKYLSGEVGADFQPTASELEEAQKIEF